MMARQQTKAEKSSEQKELLCKMRDNSPYSKNFKCYIKSDQKDLIYRRQAVTKLPRKDLEDKYIDLCDENFFLKRQNNESSEKVRILNAKLIRLGYGAPRSYSSSAILRDHTNENISNAGRSGNLSSYSKPIVRSSSLNTVYRRNVQSAASSERSKTSSSSAETGRSANEMHQKTEKGISEISEKDLNIREELTTLRNQVKELTESTQREREKCTLMETEKQKLELRLSEVDMKKFLVENIEVNRLKKKLDQIRSAARRMQSQYKQNLVEKDTIIDAERNKCNRITEQLNDERSPIATIFSDKKTELKIALRTNDMLRKQISELEFDKKSLVDQQESLSKLLKEAASQEKENPFPTANDNSELIETLELWKTEKAAIENSKNEMFNKVKQLQDMNDRLLVDLEGLKTERTFQEDIISKRRSSVLIEDNTMIFSDEMQGTMSTKHVAN